METVDPIVQKYIEALLAESSLTEKALRAGEEHYTPPTKKALRKAGRKVELDSLSDEDAEAIKHAVRTGQAIVENNTGFYKGPPGMLAKICKTLQRAGDDLGDALTIASTVMAIVATNSTANAGVSTATLHLHCAVVAFTVVRMGVRHVCAATQ